MTEAETPQPPSPLTSQLTPGSEAANNVARGAVRHLTALGISVLMEVSLPNGRRADIFGLDRKGRIICVEIKSCLTDFTSDQKWHEYLGYCDEFFFAVNQDFPLEVLPDEWGLIVADRYGAEIARPSPDQKLNAARRKSLTLAYARSAADRLLARSLED